MTNSKSVIVNQLIALTSFALLLLSGWGTNGYELYGQDTDTLPIGRHLVPKIDSSDQESAIQGALSASFRLKKGVGVEIASLHPNVVKSQFIEVGSSVGRPLQKEEIIQSVDGVPVSSEAELFRCLRGRKDSCPVQLRNIANGTLSSGVVTLRNAVVPAPRARTPLANAKLHFLHVVDTNDPQIGAAIQLNVKEWKEVIEEEIDPTRLGVNKSFVAQECTADRLLREISSLSVYEADTLFVYFQGHGAYDLNLPDIDTDASSGHFLHFVDYDLRRRDLIQALWAKKARLTILLTDSCNVRCKTPGRFGAAPKVRSKATGWTQFEELMLCHSGLVDMTSASRGQMAWCGTTVGGWFSSEAIPVFKGSPSLQVRSWDALLTHLVDRGEASFHNFKKYVKDPPKELTNQSTMIPQVFHFRVERLDPPDPIVRMPK